MFKLLLAYSRVGIPLLLGICIGVALSFIILPFLEEQNCAWNHKSSVSHSRRERSHTVRYAHFSDNIDWASFRQAEYEPHLIKSSQSESQTAKKPIRHRFLRSELNIKDTLFIGYLSDAKELYQRTSALNLSVSRPQDDPQSLNFFTDSSHSTLQKTTDRQFPSLILLNLLDANTLPLLTLKYISVHTYRYNQYKYYMFVPDSVYVQTSAVTKFLQLLNNNEEFIGFPSTDDSDACDLTIGLILSHEALSKVAGNIGGCEQMFKSTRDSHEAMDKCIRSAVSRDCTTIPAGMRLIKHEFSKEKTISSQVLLRSHVISGMKTSEDVFAVRRLLGETDLKRTQEEVDKLKHIAAQRWSNNNADLPWPLAVNKPFSTSNRFDVIRWTYIQGNTSYLEYDHVNSQLLQGHKLRLHTHVVQEALTFLNRAEDRYSLKEVIHSYRSMDPTRGLEYILSLRVHDRLLDKDETKRVELLKPLTTFQMMPTMSSKDVTPVYIIVPLYGTSDITPLLKNFAGICQKDLHVYLQVLLIYSTKEYAAYQRGTHDVFNDAKTAITESEAKAADGRMVKWRTIASENLRLVDIVADAISRLRSQFIVFTSTVGTQITAGFIGRLRANTAYGRKIYAPMAFWQYDLDLIMTNSKNSNKIDVARANGHFGEKWFDHLAFFAYDFLKSWRSEPGAFNNIYSVLLAAPNLSILRAPDPDCVVQHGYQSCSQMVTFDKDTCNAQMIDNVGSGPLLAMKLLKNGTVKGRIDQ